MKKGIGDKVLSWFVVAEDEGTPASADGAESAAHEANDEALDTGERPSAAASRTTPVPPPVVRPGQRHDAKAFAEVYARAGIANDARERLARVNELLAQLPAEATRDVQRAIVSASLKAFGVPVEQVLATCETSTGALDAHAAEGRARTEQVLAEAQARIDRLNAEIAEVRRLMDLQLRAQEELVRACATERERLRATRDFFGPDDRLRS